MLTPIEVEDKDDGDTDEDMPSLIPVVFSEFCEDEDPFVDDSDTDEDMPELECCDETCPSDGIDWEQEDENDMFQQHLQEPGVPMPDD